MPPKGKKPTSAPVGRRPTRSTGRQRSRSPLRQQEPLENDMDDWWEERRGRLRLLRSQSPEGATPATTYDPGLYQHLLDRIEMLEKKGQDLEKKVLLQGDHIDSLNLTVPSEMKEKIWNGKCVDLALLLIKSYQEDEEKDKKIAGYQDDEGNISLKSVRKKKSKLSIDQWSSAFNIFISVYIEKKPEDIQGLLSYMELIRGAARDHPNFSGWRVYDGEFRSKKESETSRPWGMIDNQLWLSIFCKPPAQLQKAQGSGSDQGGSAGDKHKRRYCKFYNSKAGCSYGKTCNYKHTCSSCNKYGHANWECTQLGKGTQNKDNKGAQSDKKQSFRSTK